MNYQVISPEKAAIKVMLPASKSISNRALMLNALCNTPGQLHNIAKCDDTDAMANALAQPLASMVNIGAAGTAMRFLTAFFATREGRTVTIDGSERMRHRPIHILVNALRSCGATIDYVGEEGFPPLRITGSKLHASEITIPGNVSSQFISAVLMIAPLIEGCRTIRLTGEVISLPYIKMTLALMEQFGVTTSFTDNVITITSSGGYHSSEFTVESDWSAASYWFEIMALLPDSDIELIGLHRNSLQGDSAVAQLFEPLGVSTQWLPNGNLRLSATGCVAEHYEACLNSTPDLAQTIVATACLCGCKSFAVSGLQTLKIKETDRIAALIAELAKVGYGIEEKPAFTLSGFSNMPVADTATISTYDDHRMAMSMAPAAVKVPNLIINNAQVVSKSYPNFWQNLAEAGFSIIDHDKK